MTEKEIQLGQHLERAAELVAAGDHRGAWDELNAFGDLIGTSDPPEMYRNAFRSLTAQCLGVDQRPMKDRS